MKVLFAVTSDSVSEAIVKKYQKTYKEILSYKNVYYYNAIQKEIQKDKSYDRIIISEDLESFSNSNYDAIDKFIYEKLDNISDEAQDLEGNEASIIFICTDRHQKGSSFLVKLFSLGIYNALLGSDRSMEQVCKLINHPRVKKEAKLYYKIDSDDANYTNATSDEVTELEIQNILTHFKKLGKNTDKYADSFNNIAEQYSDDQLKIIVNCLPINVKMVLEDECQKYQELVSVNGVISRVNREELTAKEVQRQTGIKIDMIESKKQEKISGPIVIPSSVRTSKTKGPDPVRPVGNDIDASLLGNNGDGKVKKVINKKPAINATEAALVQDNPAPKKVNSKEGLIKKVKPDGTVVWVRPKVKPTEPVAETPKAEQPKVEQPKVEEKIQQPVKPVEEKKPVVEEKNEEVNDEIDDLVLPSMDDFEDDELVLPENKELDDLDDLELPSLDDDITETLEESVDNDELILPENNEADDLDDLELPSLDNDIEETVEEVKEDNLEMTSLDMDDDDEDTLPGIDDDETPSVDGLDDLVLPSKNDELDEFDDLDLPSLDDFDDEGNEIVKETPSEEVVEELPGLEEDEEVVDELPGLDDDELPGLEVEEEVVEELPGLEEDEEVVDELPGLDDDELPGLEVEEEVVEELPGLEEDEEIVEIPDIDGLDDLELPSLGDEDEIEEFTEEVNIPGLDDDDEIVEFSDDDELTEEVEIPGLDSIDDLDLDLGTNNEIDDMLPDLDEEPLVSQNIEEVEDSKTTGQIESIKPRVDYSMSSLNSLLTKDKKIVTFIGSGKNGTSFLINNLAALFSSLGISTAILDMTKNRNSYYIYTNNDENLRNIAYNSISKLQKGFAEGIKVDKNLSVYTALPNDGKDYTDAEPILSTLVQNHSLVLIDCDFDTDPSYFASCQEIYLVQSMDILTIQPLTAFLRDLKSQGVLEAEKVRVVINKELKMKTISAKDIIKGMSFYNDPAMAFMTELFNKDIVKACSIPFDESAYSRYLDCMVNCNVSISGYSKQFISKLRNLGDMVYPLVSKSTSYGGAKAPEPSQNFGKKSIFSNNTNDTLNQMKKKI